MKNFFLKIAAFCLISNITFSMQERNITLNHDSKIRLLSYALEQSGRDNYWPEGAEVSLESFCPMDNGEYEARFYGRYRELKLVNGCLVIASICRPRNAYMSVARLKNLGVELPE